MKGARKGWCVRCNEERPIVRAWERLGEAKPFPSKRGVGRFHWACLVCHEPVKPAGLRQKYGAVPTRTPEGKLRHSRKEARREAELRLLAQAGDILDFRCCNDSPRQVFRLDVYGVKATEHLVALVEDVLANGMTLIRSADLRIAVRDLKRSIQRITSYIPDFTYRDAKTRYPGEWVVEDVKGYKTREYELKKRLMIACHDVEVKET